VSSKPKRGSLFSMPTPDPDPTPVPVQTALTDQPPITEPPSDESSVVQLPAPMPRPRPVTPVIKPDKPKQNRATTRIGKRLVTAYVEPEALKQLQFISIEEEVTIQALLIEGLNAVFQKRGLTRLA
jgi:ribosomal protein S10